MRKRDVAQHTDVSSRTGLSFGGSATASSGSPTAHSHLVTPRVAPHSTRGTTQHTWHHTAHAHTCTAWLHQHMYSMVTSAHVQHGYISTGTHMYSMVTSAQVHTCTAWLHQHRYTHVQHGYISTGTLPALHSRSAYIKSVRCTWKPPAHLAPHDVRAKPPRFNGRLVAGNPIRALSSGA